MICNKSELFLLPYSYFCLNIVNPLRTAPLKIFLFIIAGIPIMLSGVMPAFGIDLLYGGKSQSVNRWPYSFGDRYKYDNAGSSWNYDSAYKPKHNTYRYHHRNRHPKYWPSYFKYQSVGHTDEKFQDLIEHFSRHNFYHFSPFRRDSICR